MSSVTAEGTSCNLPEVDARTRLLLEAPLFLTLLKLAAPNTIVMVTQVTVGLIEVYFVAKLGIGALAGVSQVFPLVALMVAVSQGATGGGVLTLIARSLGQGHQKQADDLVWYALATAVPLGLLSTAVMLLAGPHIYRASGAAGDAFDAANSYSDVIFSGAVLIWTFNLLMSAIRGTGNLVLPVFVVCGGAIVLVPLSPLLIFGAFGWSGFGVIGGAIAMLIYYAVGCAVYAAYLWGHRGLLRPTARPPALHFSIAKQILKIGGLSALVASSTNITFAIVTGFVGAFGTQASAGYGAGMRLELLLVPLCYGIGGPVGLLVSTNLGAGNTRRAYQASWMGIAIAAFVAEAIGLTAAIWPTSWLRLFSDDPAMIDAGVIYLQTVGPVFGFFGVGYVLYCVGQGMRRMFWPVVAALTRSGVAVVGGLLSIHAGTGLVGIFWGVVVGMTLFGLIGLPNVFGSVREQANIR